MIHTLRALGGMAVAPHHLAAQAARDVLRDGGNAVEAMVAAAATIAVVYPHMNAIGGDGFWLIHEPGQAMRAIDACGPAARRATRDFYQGAEAIPSRGPLAALTVAGTVSGWARALDVSARWGGTLDLPRLLGDAIRHAHDGVTVTASQAALTRAKLNDGLGTAPGFAATYLADGQPPPVGHRLRQPALADTLRHLATRGLDDFYRGELGARIGAALQRAGSPVDADDLADYRADFVEPLAVKLRDSTVYNLPPPTQGLSTLMILGLFDQLGVGDDDGDSFAHVHGLVEATKRAFRVRDRVVTDPARLPEDPRAHLEPAALAALAQQIDAKRALPWPDPSAPGDTIWMGVVDREGRAVSFIQSVYWEFGSGTVLDGLGICWQNRGTSFSLDPRALNALEPGRKPFHTLNPSLALFDDGRVMPFGTMGGEGQPQTQAAVFTRYARFGQPLQQAVSAPRWLLGRTWGASSTSLKLESRFDPALVRQLADAGHVVEVLDEPFSDTMGGEGQPQTQAAVFTRYARFGQPLQQAVSAPRWLLGRTWGASSTSLKLESRFHPALVRQLAEAGHVVEVLDEAFSDTMGHAGALVRRADGVIEGAADPRSDGAVAGV